MSRKAGISGKTRSPANTCGRCGRPVAEGEFCPECREALRQLNRAEEFRAAAVATGSEH